MRFVVIIVAALVIVGLAAFGLVYAQKGATPTVTAASTDRVASVTQNEIFRNLRARLLVIKRTVRSAA
jgi:hypothetical protein